MHPDFQITGTHISPLRLLLIVKGINTLYLLPSMTTLSVDDALSQAGDSLQAAVSALWHLDTNRLRPFIDYRLNVQSRTEYCSHDAASQPFVSYISDDVWTRPTYGLFKRLLDNYTAETGVPEVVSQEERAEEDHFLAAVCDTDCIQFVHRWLLENTHMKCETMDDFSQLLKDVWFYHYSRDGSRDSSGFEHVFCGEIDDGKVKGMHNFVQVLLEEQRGNFDYQGYLDVRGEPCEKAPPSSQQLIIIRFEWLGEIKSCSSMFVGVSPEFEMALYTMLYASDTERLHVQFGPYTACIKVYQMAGRIGTAFPELRSVDVGLLEEDISATDAVEDESQVYLPNLHNGGIESEFPPINASALYGGNRDSEFPPLGSGSDAMQEGVSYADVVLGGGEKEEDGEEGNYDQEDEFHEDGE